MQKGLTELVFVLDKSGSMAGLEKDTIGGFNAMLEKQKAVHVGKAKGCTGRVPHHNCIVLDAQSTPP